MCMPMVADAAGRLTLQVSGLHTNLDFLRRIVAHPAFAAGELDTQFISKHRQQLFAAEQLTPDLWALAAALLHQVLVAEVRPVVLQRQCVTKQCLSAGGEKLQSTDTRAELEWRNLVSLNFVVHV